MNRHEPESRTQGHGECTTSPRSASEQPCGDRRKKKARQRPKPAAEPFRGRVSRWNTTRLNQDDKSCDGQFGEKVTKVDTARSPARTAALKSVLVRVADGYPDLARDSIGVVFPTD